MKMVVGTVKIFPNFENTFHVTFSVKISSIYFCDSQKSSFWRMKCALNFANLAAIFDNICFESLQAHIE